MSLRFCRLIASAALMGLSLQASALSAQAHTALIEAIESPHRSHEFLARDRYRHPYETLAFFEVYPQMSVVEVWPGGGWYTDILAPYLLDKGQLYAAHFDPRSEVAFFQRSRDSFAARIKTHSRVMGQVHMTALVAGAAAEAGPVAGADRVLTFRNVHNWLKAGNAEAMFTVFFELLKPGGLLGVVEHRAAPGTSLQAMIDSGYVTEDQVIKLAAQAGFELVGKSEINANPRDSKDHPAGVWTLPPRLKLGEQDRDHYLAIGESDRMTLKFRKPVAPTP